MSNDWISRSALIEFLTKTEDEYKAKIAEENLEDDPFADGISSALFGFLKAVKDFPTAYDVDKVVEQLEAKDEYCNSEGLIKKLRLYAEVYRNPPYGREVEGTPELLEEAALQLQYAANSINAMKRRFIDGIKVHYQGQDADDEIECPLCGHMVAWNDSYDAENPSHCPDCGTKLIY